MKNLIFSYQIIVLFAICLYTVHNMNQTRSLCAEWEALLLLPTSVLRAHNMTLMPPPNDNQSISKSGKMKILPRYKECQNYVQMFLSHSLFYKINYNTHRE